MVLYRCLPHLLWWFLSFIVLFILLLVVSDFKLFFVQSFSFSATTNAFLTIVFGSLSISSTSSYQSISLCYFQYFLPILSFSSWPSSSFLMSCHLFMYNWFTNFLISFSDLIYLSFLVLDNLNSRFLFVDFNIILNSPILYHSHRQIQFIFSIA